MDCIAPVAIFVYNKYKETMETVKALSKNTLAKETDVYIFSNAPQNDNSNDLIKIDKIRNHIQKYACCFKVFEIVCREENNGPNDNMIKGISYLLNKYDRVIVLEDDIVTCKSFLTFMNQALCYYKNNESVFSICGYNPVIKKSNLEGDSFFYDVFRSWGWGIWKKQWDDFIINPVKYEKIDLKKYHNLALTYYPTMQAHMIYKNNLGMRLFLDYFLACKQFENNQTVVYPKKSMCDNIGLRGNGLTIHNKNSKYINKNFDLKYEKNSFNFGAQKLTVKSDPNYFFKFRLKAFAMNYYKDCIRDPGFLYKNMFYLISYMLLNNITIGNSLKRKNLNKLVIYGKGSCSDLIIPLFQKIGLEIVYFMSRNKFYDADGNECDCRKLNKFDAIIVTPTYIFDKIYKELIVKYNYVDLPILAIDDILLYDLYNTSI